MVANTDDEWKKAYASFSLAKKSAKTTSDLMVKEKKSYSIYYGDFVTWFIDFANAQYAYYEKIAKGVDYTSMELEYTGASFIAENYIEKKDSKAFEFN